jgi:hypothetical protein
MGHLRIRGGFAWSADDEATFRRWRRAVCLFYGGIVLVLAAICVAHPDGERRPQQCGIGGTSHTRLG